ncbi:MAG: hypothetical protein MUO77_03265, partial [Anaerolineales bacterium]|nr:hypothetical protein [Anaerolineales bacterium]
MPRKISEERTRKEMIVPQLETAGWYLRDHSKVKIEILMIVPPLSLQEEFAPCRGSSSGVVARVESLRGRIGESERQV